PLTLFLSSVVYFFSCAIAPAALYTLSLHDALPISVAVGACRCDAFCGRLARRPRERADFHLDGALSCYCLGGRRSGRRIDSWAYAVSVGFRVFPGAALRC